MGFEINGRTKLLLQAGDIGMREMGVYCVLGAEAARHCAPEEFGWVGDLTAREMDPDESALRTLVKHGLLVEHVVNGFPGYRFVTTGTPPWCRFVSSYARPAIPRRMRQAVYERDGYRCVYCDANEDLTLDHVWPYLYGGGADMDNLVTACRSCNASKGARV